MNHKNSQKKRTGFSPVPKHEQWPLAAGSNIG
jgi:hypothetical protein